MDKAHCIICQAWIPVQYFIDDENGVPQPQPWPVFPPHDTNGNPDERCRGAYLPANEVWTPQGWRHQ